VKVQRINRQLNITLPPRIRAALEAYCSATERKRSDVISSELREFLTKEGYYSEKDLLGAVAAAGQRIIEMDQIKLRAAEDPGKSDPQSTGAAGNADGGAGKPVDPSSTSTPTTYPKPQKRKPSA
jgi:hypothetical protein